MPVIDSTSQSLRAVDAWIDVINANINGGVRTAYKGARMKFAGSTPALQRTGTGGVLPIQIPSATLVTQATTLDFAPGDVIDSTEDTHMAINGDGFFMLVEPTTGKILLTRDGEFHYDKLNRLVNRDGLLVMNKQMAINIGPAAPLPLPPLTVNDVNSGTTGWRPAVPGFGGGLWFPYVGGTIYDEGGTSYQNQTIFAKRGYYLSGGNLTGNLRIASDNASWVMVNGVLLSAADVLSGMNPPTDNGWLGQFTQYNLGPYLHSGYNEIIIKVTEGSGGNYFDPSGSIGGQTILADGGWATMVSGLGPNPGVPNAAELKLVNAQAALTDVVLTPGPDSTDRLEYSKYGATIYEWTDRPGTLPVETPGTNHTGSLAFRALETSNVSMSQSLPELALAQKMFSALTKVLTVHQNDQDALNNLLK